MVLSIKIKEYQKEYQKKWAILNREKVRASSKRYYWNHREKELLRNSIYKKTHPEVIRRNGNNWNFLHRQFRLDAAKKRYVQKKTHIAAIGRVYHAKNKLKRNAATREWQKKNPERVLALCNRRRAQKMGASGWGYTTEQHIRWRWEMWGGRCYLCGGKAEATDHVFPLSKGGSHFPANLRPICNKCNNFKSNKIPKFDFGEEFDWTKQMRPQETQGELQ